MRNSIENNIFHCSKGDGVAYLVLYIIIPVLITTLSLANMSKTDKVAEIYCYISIMIIKYTNKEGSTISEEYMYLAD